MAGSEMDAFFAIEAEGGLGGSNGSAGWRTLNPSQTRQIAITIIAMQVGLAVNASQRPALAAI
jgi:hypothetical protein